MQARKSDFADWKNHPFTQAAAQETAEAVEQLIAQMINRRESNPSDDQWIKGFIQGVQSLLNWEPEFVEENEKNA